MATRQANGTTDSEQHCNHCGQRIEALGYDLCIACGKHPEDRPEEAV